ncbi:MAG TPA: acyltransferase [Actinomycetota bacterium]|jgi:peptidoglycan/LPS O-acetylase OafA/YrhL|nr:acyltransferase [Actinomycetota bacterium]
MSAPPLQRIHKVTRAEHSAPAHFPALDGVRGIAILAVVGFHIAVVASAQAPWAYRASPPVASWPIFAGSLGVDVFFVLSGLLVYRSWQSLRARYRSEGLRSVVEFARRRGRRILPPYWFALLILIPWRAPHWLESLDGCRNIGMFASLNQFLDTKLPGELSTVTWSLTTETHFYLALPILALAMARFGWRVVLPALIVTTLVWRAAAGGTGAEAEWIFGRADQFVAGIAASSLIADFQSGRRSALLRWLTGRRAGLVLVASLAGLVVAHGSMRLLPKPLVFTTVLHPLAGLLVAGLLVRIVCTGKMRVLHNGVLGSLGLISYSLYLWHWPLLAEAVARWGTSAPVIAGALAAGLTASVASYWLLERPFVGAGAARADQPEPGTTEATIANSPWSAPAAVVAVAPLGNNT